MNRRYCDATTGPRRRYSAGFSLVEIAIVMVIIGLILASVAGPLGNYKAKDRYQETREYLENTRQALLIFAAAKGHLPCPDNDNDGDEDRAGPNTCDTDQGLLPYLDLGLERETAWGEVPTYIVHGRAADEDCDAATNEAECFFDDSTGFNFATKAGQTGKLNIEDADSNKLVEQGIALMISYGSNTAATLADCDNSGGELEHENCDGNSKFIHTSYRGAEANSYDDQLIWLDQLSVKGALIGN